MVGADILLDVRKLQGIEIDQGEAGVGTADIGNQSASGRAAFQHDGPLVTRFLIRSELAVPPAGL
jgi:hypothetical protein